LATGLYLWCHSCAQAEGIFRISASTSDLQALKQQLESGDYEIKTGAGASPHTPAALLKAWLRDLSTPLIPFDQYDACIAVGKVALAYASPSSFVEAFVFVRAAQDVSHDDDGATATAGNRITAILKQVPPINRRVVAHLTLFMEKVGQGSSCFRLFIVVRSVFLSSARRRGALIDCCCLHLIDCRLRPSRASIR
jgi:hypothetical protein